MKLDLNSIEQYLLYCSQQKRLDPKTVKAYRIDLLQFYTYFEHIEVTKQTLNPYIVMLHQQFRPKTVRRKLSSIQAYFSYCIFMEELKENPMHQVQIRFKEAKLLPRTIAASNLQSLFHSVYTTLDTNSSYKQKLAVRNVAIIELLMSTGIRVSELCNLKCDDVNLKEQHITIYGKGAKERVLHIGNSFVLNALINYTQVYAKELENSMYFFLNRFDERLSDQSVRLLLKKHEQSKHLNQHITPHMFRHTFATMLLEKDVDIRYIQQILGHSSILTTQIYTQIRSNKQKEILSLKNPRVFLQQGS